MQPLKGRLIVVLVFLLLALNSVYTSGAAGAYPEQTPVASDGKKPRNEPSHEELSFDAYDPKRDMAWFFERFNYSTFYYPTKMNVKTFDTEEYQKLIKVLLYEKESWGDMSRFAGIALRYSLFRYLNNHPDDPKYQLLKKKIESKDFMRIIVKSYFNFPANGFAYHPVIEDKTFLLELISIRPYSLVLGSERLRDDMDVVKAAVEKDGTMLQHASEKLRDSKETVMIAMMEDSAALKHASNRLKDDKSIAQTILDMGSPGYAYLSIDIRTNSEFMAKMLDANPGMLEFAIDPDRESVLNAVKKSRYPARVMPFIPYRFTSDEEILKAGFAKEIRPANSDEYTDFGKVALVNDDGVRVRDKPGSGGKYVGVLYRNMIVNVLAESKNRQVIRGDSHHWYKIKSDEFQGWTYGKFLSFYVPDKKIDTYSYPHRSFESEDSSWFSEYLGNYSAASSTNLALESITINQFRILIRCVMGASCNDNARVFLSNTIYPYLKQHPNDPKYAYLKKKLYSPEFLKMMFNKGNIPEYILLYKGC